MASGKKIFLWGCLGCGGFLALLILVIVGGAGVFVFRAVQFGTEITQEYASISENYQQLDQEFPFTPPENNQLTEERVQEFLLTRSNAVAFAEQFGDKFGQMGDEIGQTFDKGGIGSAFSGAGKIGDIIKEAAMMPATIGNEHLKLLRDAQMSPDEYVWYTKTILGTLLKAKDNQYEDGQAQWIEYQTAFDAMRNNFKHMNVNTGQMQIDGSDIDINNLLIKINDVNYNQQNADLLQQHAEKFVIEGNAAMLDYLAVHLDEILQDFLQKHSALQTQGQ